MFFSHFRILPKLAKFFPDKIKYEREGHTELRPYNSSVEEVLGRKETHQLSNQGKQFLLKYNFSSKELLQSEWSCLRMAGFNSSPFSNNAHAFKNTLWCWIHRRCWSTGMSLLWTSQHSERNIGLEVTHLLRSGWVGLNRTQIFPLWTTFLACLERVWCLDLILKKYDGPKSRENSKEKRIKNKTKQNNTKKPSMTHRLPQWQFHSILQSYCGTFLTVFMNKKILFSIQSCQKKRKQFWLWKHCCEF